MTPLSEAQAALAELRKCTLGFQQARQANPNAWLNTHNSKTEQHLVAAINLLGGSAKITPKPAAPKPPPSPTPPPPVSSSIFAGKGLFTTSSSASASGHPCDWVAVQMDPEGDHSGFNNNPAKLCYWQARPTHDVVELANSRKIPYIGQAENLSELSACFDVGPDLTVPKAIIGNPRAWGADGQKLALEQGWDAISEWYWNAHPWESPDGGDYPRFVNICFGIYSEGTPGQPGYTPQDKTVADYRAKWGGSYSVWAAEHMTPSDWAAF